VVLQVAGTGFESSLGGHNQYVSTTIDGAAIWSMPGAAVTDFSRSHAAYADKLARNAVPQWMAVAARPAASYLLLSSRCASATTATTTMPFARRTATDRSHGRPWRAVAVRVAEPRRDDATVPCQHEARLGVGNIART
jgi:hypothetical protein